VPLCALVNGYGVKESSESRQQADAQDSRPASLSPYKPSELHFANPPVLSLSINEKPLRRPTERRLEPATSAAGMRKSDPNPFPRKCNKVT
jgi:hypothetical protein